jgi:SAM-dependent methyltransferase
VNTRDAIELIRSAVPARLGTWADLGAGDGTFSRALARLLGQGSRIYAVDRDPDAIASLRRLVGTDGVELIPVLGDFTRPLELREMGDQKLDGMLFANALHFVPNPGPVLARLITGLGPGGRVVIVEYDGRRANRWVPHPLPASRVSEVVIGAGLSRPTITATRPSAYGGTIYVATASMPVNRRGVHLAAEPRRPGRA